MGEQQKVATEVAESEFVRFVEAMDLDVDPKGMDDEDKASFEGAKRRFVGAVQDGRLVVNDSGEPVFTPKDGEPITFYEPTGASYMAMDAKKAGHDVKRTTAVLADITRKNEASFSRMKSRDFKVCMALVALFMAG